MVVVQWKCKLLIGETGAGGSWSFSLQRLDAAAMAVTP